MNKLHIIGNLTRDPELRTTANGINVCDFTVAVNKRGKKDQNNQQPEADFFRVSAWRELGENCAKYLAKGRKVAVLGPVSGRMYTGNDGVQRMSLEVTADEVEFLTPNPNGQQAQTPTPAYPGAQPAYPNAGYPNAAYVPQVPQGYAQPPQGYAYPQQAMPQQAPAPQAYQQQQMPIAGAQPGAVPPGFTEVNTDDLPF